MQQYVVQRLAVKNKPQAEELYDELLNRCWQTFFHSFKYLHVIYCFIFFSGNYTIAFANSFFDEPIARRDLINKSIETVGSPFSILATLD
jgi:hypothetical protein